jgi:hypothetical protein
MVMLALDDRRWKDLRTFFGKPADLPKVLEAWMRVIGSAVEYRFYCQEVLDMFLHQATISNAAFAVVPWLVDVCKQRSTVWQMEYLTDVALVEANRLTYGVYTRRAVRDPYPTWLMADYHQAIIDARDLTDDAIEAEPDVERKHGLVALKPAFYGNADVAWAQWGHDRPEQ